MKNRMNSLVVVLLMSVAGVAQAAGFALYENNASGLGTAFAGQAAVAQDASTIFFNPAGLTRIEGRQLVGSMTYINPSAEFYGSSTITGYGTAMGSGGDAGFSAFVPGGFYAMDINPNLKFGIGVYAPFGLATDYDFPWAGMTQALYSHMQTIDVNPTLAWKINDRISVGVGVNWQNIEVELTGYSGAPGFITMAGNDSSWGYNFGVLAQVDEATRLGVSYRSKVKHQLTGDVTFSSPIDPYVDGPITASIELPDMASISIFRTLNRKWDLLADATWTGWSTFDKLEAPEVPTTGYLVETAWEDAWRFTLGFQYHADEKWTWRAGIAYDQTPIPDAQHRTARIPDEDRVSLALGAQYRMSRQTRLDIGYMHIFFDDAAIAHTENGVVLTGSFESAADIFGAQFTYNF